MPRCSSGGTHTAVRKPRVIRPAAMPQEKLKDIIAMIKLSCLRADDGPWYPQTSLSELFSHLSRSARLAHVPPFRPRSGHSFVESRFLVVLYAIEQRIRVFLIMRKRGLSLVVYCVLAAIPETQATSGSFVGTVRDPSGHPVPMCVITITSVATGAIQSFRTNARRNYVARNLQPRRYAILMEAPGFGQSRLANMQSQTRQTVRIDGKLSFARQVQTVASAMQPGSNPHSKSNSKESS